MWNRRASLKPTSRPFYPTLSLEIVMSVAWNFRPGTLDEGVFNCVVAANEYQLPVKFLPGDIVVDVGAHIGAFAYAVLSRGCRNVYCVEADRENARIAADHLRPYMEQGLVKLVCGAVWRSDPNEDELFFDGYHRFPDSFPTLTGIINTGNGSVIWGQGTPVRKIAFDEMIDSVTDQGRRRVRLLKLDCEGAEWPILLTSRRLHLIDEICGEFHEIGGEYLEINETNPAAQPVFNTARFAKFTVDELTTVLGEAGFVVSYRRHQRPNGVVEGLGLFFAKRKNEE